MWRRRCHINLKAVLLLLTILLSLGLLGFAGRILSFNASDYTCSDPTVTEKSRSEGMLKVMLGAPMIAAGQLGLLASIFATPDWRQSSPIVCTGRIKAVVVVLFISSFVALAAALLLSNMALRLAATCGCSSGMPGSNAYMQSSCTCRWVEGLTSEGHSTNKDAAKFLCSMHQHSIFGAALSVTFCMSSFLLCCKLCACTSCCCPNNQEQISPMAVSAQRRQMPAHKVGAPSL